MGKEVRGEIPTVRTEIAYKYTEPLRNGKKGSLTYIRALKPGPGDGHLLSSGIMVSSTVIPSP